MTRINATIPPAKLCDQHLVAEYREILRTFALARKKAAKYGQYLEEFLPEQFTLGTGHVLFFYDKLEFVHKRFNALRQEILDRGFQANMEFDDSILEGLEYLYWDWPGDDGATELVVNRIYERAKTMKRITFGGQSVNLEQYLSILNQ